ncbi:MAG: sulfatase-like hydrolase/transferase [Planctomycetota bacterium]
MSRLLCFSLLLLASRAGADERPNVMVIVTDDQSPFTLSCYGDEHCDTPNLDRLASSGMVLDQMYHMGSMSGAVCSPSRTMIMSGRTLWHLPPRGKKVKKDEVGATEGNRILHNTIPAVFNRAGYDTFRTCKKGNSYTLANALFTTVRDKSCRKAGTEDGSQWHGQQVIDFLDERKSSKTTKPFLIYFGFSHPHDPRVGRDDLLAKYGAENRVQPPSKVNSNAPPLPKTWLPAHPFHHGHPGLRDEVKVPGVLTSRTEATIRNELGREFACIENVDEQIGQVMERLRESGELQNTFVIFTSDHGISVGRHGLTGKQNLYEHTWRVPFLVSGPGIRPGSRARANGYLLDILPTICDLAGISIPETAQGKSLEPVLMGNQDSVREVLYGCYCGGTKPGMRSVRKGDWKLIKYDTMDGKVRETQLFHLTENPDELLIEHHDPAVIQKTGYAPKPHEIDLAESPQHAAKLAEMEALLLSEMERLRDPYRLWDQPPLEGAKEKRRRNR